MFDFPLLPRLSNVSFFRDSNCELCAAEKLPFTLGYHVIAQRVKKTVYEEEEKFARYIERSFIPASVPPSRQSGMNAERNSLMRERWDNRAIGEYVSRWDGIGFPMRHQQEWEREEEGEERTSASHSSMDHEESNGRRNGDGRNRRRRYLETELGCWRARRSHDLETGDDHRIVPGKYGSIHVHESSTTRGRDLLYFYKSIIVVEVRPGPIA